MQLYQGFWQLRAFNFFFTRVTSIKFRHFRINIGYDYFHISLFLIFVYFFFFYRNLPIYLSYFRFFSLNMKSIFCISIVSPPNVSNKGNVPRFWVIFSRNFSTTRHHNLHKEAHNKLLFTCSSVRAEETRNVYEIFSLLPASLPSSRNATMQPPRFSTSFLEFRLRSYL